MSRPLVLVVDPDADSRAILAAYLQHAGYEVVQVNSAAAGLAAARQRRPAVIVGEHPVRAADGTPLCESLRRDPATVNIPFVAVTSRVTAEELDHAQRGHFRVFAKPADFAAVLGTVRAAADRRCC